MKLGNGIAAIVTGGASGLGEAVATALAEAGCKVTIFDVNREAGHALAKSIGARFCFCDVTSEASVAEALESARAANGPERVLVTCAGIAIGQKTVSRDKATGEPVPHCLSAFEKVVAVNLVGTFRMVAIVASSMAKLDPVTPDGERGVIICTASVAAEDGQIGQAAYAASKGGVAAMTLPVARDLARDGIRVNTILRVFSTRRCSPAWRRMRGARSRRRCLSVPARRSFGVRGARAPYLRERHVERRAYPYRRRLASGSALTSRRKLHLRIGFRVPRSNSLGERKHSRASPYREPGRREGQRLEPCRAKS